jgi:hypothetical protein
LIVTVTDNQGNRAIKTRNFTLIFDNPPPGTIYVNGVVLDTRGNPVPEAVLTFQSDIDNYRLMRNITTNDDGNYSMTTFGFHQKITVQKSGYQTIIQEESFEPYGHGINFTLHPQSNMDAGLDVLCSVFAIVLMFLVYRLKYS